MSVGGNFKDKQRWSIHTARDFNYVNQGKCFGVERINDEKDYSDMREALRILNFDQDDEGFMLDIVAGLLHLGQVVFERDRDGEGSELSKEASSTSALTTALGLLGLPQKEFVKSVTERTIVAVNEKYQKKLTSTQASDARDSISRLVYGKLFDWVVATINKSIKTKEGVLSRSEIAVLDIFGFECLKENSFEQLCINYTNETLQQQFNKFIFKMEQLEYEAENIEWSFVSFPDNQDCLDLIESKKKSIFRLLDDECMLAGGTDEKFASRMIKELAEFDRLSVSTVQRIEQQFCIHHYAGEVVYSTKTFLVRPCYAAS
jgi:myosin-5